ncbi:MAG: carbohydrate binding family 9 domain-containing protein [Acidobacteria bacterium]|nr:carbohydrate binding family 9 domain-containing protein [Acidobacteriota bacterium]
MPLHLWSCPFVCRCVAGVALGALLVARPAHGQSERGAFTMPAIRAPQPPVIDGIIGSDEWRTASRGDRFIQFQPNRGEPSPFHTVVYVQYDDERLYVAFEAHDAEPLMGQMTERDAQLWNDDSVQIYLDTFHDARSGYYFMTNVLGTQLDGRIAEDGTSNDGTWDAPWDSAARRTDYGYAVEVAIPFSPLQYPAGDNVTWGVNFARTRRRSLERSYWAGPVDQWGRLSQAGDLVGLHLRPQTRRHQLIPYALGQAQEGQPAEGAIGLDLRYAVTPQTSAYLTVNPDFATIEADQEEINLTRFELSLTEKRQFFLEGQELFNQRIQTFYSRRIGDITAGTKALGRQNGWTFALLATRGDIERRGAAYTVARVQRDVSSRSNVGVLFANRSHAGVQQGSLGLDANLFFSDTFGFTGQLVRSHGRRDDGALAFFARPSYDSSTAHAHIRYTHLGDAVADNVNALGFIVDDDRRELDGAIEKTVWVTGGAVERVEYTSNYNAYWATRAATLRSWQADQAVSIDWRNRLATGVSHTEEFKRFEKDFRNRKTGVELGFNTRAYESVRAGLTVGRNFEADFRLFTAAAVYKVTDMLSTEYELQRLTLDPDPDDDSTWIHVVRANQFFTRDLFLRLFLQTNSTIDRRNVQAVFVYRYRPPFGTMQVAYQRGTAEFGERSKQGHTLFLKLTAVL